MGMLAGLAGAGKVEQKLPPYAPSSFCTFNFHTWFQNMYVKVEAECLASSHWPGPKYWCRLLPGSNFEVPCATSLQPQQL